ncbi:MAG: hypothetical protein J6O70_01730 [Lachnospiraceae bacterium]|nr:hypothetical protein [Lachnospiraceae bacterium]
MIRISNFDSNGKITPNGVSLEKHEYATVLLLTEMGYDVELVPRSTREGEHTPDIIIDNVKWEMKSPTGETRNTIKNNIQGALRQSVNVILDLRRVKRPMEKCLRDIEREFTHNKKLRRLLVIAKSKKVLDFSK